MFDLSDTLQAETRADPSFVADLKQGLITVVAEADGMYTGNKRHYLHVGRSALNCIRLATAHGVMGENRIRSVLDFACGFGRVGRWLVAAYPDAEIVAMDVDSKAVCAVQEILGVRGYVIGRDWTNLPNERFELIWCGSLFTHLSRERSGRLLGLISKLLQPNGILATTTHGNLIFDQIRRREKTYNLPEEALDGLLSSYLCKGYGFSPYRPGLDYGIAICSPGEFFVMGSRTNLNPIIFLERGWAEHQDFFAFHRLTDSVSFQANGTGE